MEYGNNTFFTVILVIDASFLFMFCIFSFHVNNTFFTVILVIDASFLFVFCNFSFHGNNTFFTQVHQMSKD